MKKIKTHRAKTTEPKFIGMAPFDGYDDIAKEEIKMLKKMAKEEARIQTEILLLATKWMK